MTPPSMPAGPFDKLADAVTSLAAETKMSAAEVKALNAQRERLSRFAVFLIGAILVAVVLLIGLTVFNYVDRNTASERAREERTEQTQILHEGLEDLKRTIVLSERCQVLAGSDIKKYDDCLIQNNVLAPPTFEGKTTK